MAHLVQSLIYPREHDVIPYLVVELICQQYCPEFKDDPKFMISLCACALLFDNPGVGFFKAIEEARCRKLSNGYTLYRVMLRDYIVKCKEEEITLQDMILSKLDSLLENTQSAAWSDMKHLTAVISNCKKEVEARKNVLLDVIYNGDIHDQNFFDEVFLKIYGIPYIRSNNGEFTPSVDGEEAKEKDNILGLELVYNRLTEKEGKVCGWYDVFCKQHQYDDDSPVEEFCAKEQWKKTTPCIMKNAFDYFELTETMNKLLDSDSNEE